MKFFETTNQNSTYKTFISINAPHYLTADLYKLLKNQVAFFSPAQQKKITFISGFGVI